MITDVLFMTSLLLPRSLSLSVHVYLGKPIIIKFCCAITDLLANYHTLIKKAKKEEKIRQFENN